MTGLTRGDEVFGESIDGYQWTNGGAFAEYTAVRGDNLARKPAGVSFEQAAAVPTSGYIALSGLRDQGRLRAGQRVLINGAGAASASWRCRSRGRSGPRCALSTAPRSWACSGRPAPTA